MRLSCARQDALDQDVMARLTQRDDDTEEALAKRLESFSANRESVAAAYNAFSLTVDGNRPVDDVWADICAYLDKPVAFA